MKFRRRHLVLMMISVFTLSMTILNLRYDSLYRVPGIDNQARELIRTYLNEPEQKYLVEQAIPTPNFIPYIKEPGFSIYRHQIYKTLSDLQLASSPSEIVVLGNELYQRFRDLGMPLDAMALTISTLDINAMFYDFINQSDFHPEHIYIYDFMRTKLEITDSSYVQYGNRLFADFEIQDINKRSLIEQKLDLINKHYLGTELKACLDQMLSDPMLALVYEPLLITVLVNDQHTIGTYTLKPEQLVKVEDFVEVVNEPIWLRKEAFLRLPEICNQLHQINPDKSCGGMVIKQGYLSKDQLPIELVGKDERQLGLTIEIGFDSDNIEELVEYRWLREHIHQFGYILRYPKTCIEETKRDYQPYVFRYVGEKAATAIFQRNECLETYDE